MRNHQLNYLFIFLLVICQTSIFKAQENIEYQKPPKHLADLIEAPETPGFSLSADGTKILLMHRPGMPSIEEVAEEEFRLAGIRINPRTNGPSRSASYYKLSVKDVQTLAEKEFSGIPEKARIQHISWSPDNKKIAFTITRQDGIEFWVASVEDYQAKRLSELKLNAISYGLPYEWLSDSKTLIIKTIPADRGAQPLTSSIPTGPVIQSNTGEKEAPVRTYQDLLRNKTDEALFRYFAMAELVLLDIEGNVKKLGRNGIYLDVSASPNGQYILLTELLEPFSYIVPANSFAQKFEIIDLQGNLIRKLGEVPAAENIPKGFGATREGPRSFQWRSDAPATLFWVECLDKGDPRLEVEFRDQVYFLEMPFNGEPVKSIKTKLRYSGIIWGNSNLALAYSRDWKSRRMMTHSFMPDKAESPVIEIFNRSSEDQYTNPGNFETFRNQYGREVLLFSKNAQFLYLLGLGASPQGNQPFIDEFEIKTKKTKRLWQSKAPFYEQAYSIVDLSKSIALTRKESVSETPNYFLVHFKSGKTIRQLTAYEHPFPTLKGIRSELISYERKDGVKLNGKLYLPTGYNREKDGPLPLIMWAYPQEFKSADAAGQITDSPYRFIRLSPNSPLLWLADGYAILDNPSFPIIGEGNKEPNDTYIDQLVADAEAAVNKLVEMGIADKDKIAVGGHSYGAFMTANLLTHCDLFAAGIARSGAYNRTLTPFGFQSEERTFWEAPEVYHAMSPFNHVEKIKKPILLIHGEADNNSGTFPIQTERYFAALKGNGKLARMVLLPAESHGYRAYESIMHMVWEMNEWLNRYVKQKP